MGKISTYSDAALGIDGCRSGWVVVAFRGAQAHIDVFPHIAEIWRRYPSPALALVDIPIGLPSQAPAARECDRMARDLLRPRRHHSIFNPPCRAASEAPRDQARRVNREKTGKDLSQQSLNLLPKIQEVDTFLRELPITERTKIAESHPEILFWALNGGQALEWGKKQAQGKEERLFLLNQTHPRALALYWEGLSRIPRAAAQRDDLIDAIALGLAASFIGDEPRRMRQLPATAPFDEKGLPMRIVYFS
jgi:predicted RNase H-like nuclease